MLETEFDSRLAHFLIGALVKLVYTEPFGGSAEILRVGSNPAGATMIKRILKFLGFYKPESAEEFRVRLQKTFNKDV